MTIDTHDLPTRPLLFLHVTKCGGTSMRAALRRSLLEAGAHPSEIYELDAPASAELAGRAGIETFELRDLLLATELQRGCNRLIAGHFRYTSLYHEPLLNRCSSVTMLREPVDRFLSLYYYNHFKANAYGREEMPLADYLKRPRARRSAEDYVRILRGCGGDHRRFATEDDIVAAQRNLERFDLVGTLDDLDQFRARLTRVHGLAIELPVLNRTPAPVEERYADLSPALMSQIQDLCEPSRRVFQHAQTLSALITEAA